MKDYYQYFVNKGNHPDKQDILDLEKQYQFQIFNDDQAKLIIEKMIKVSRRYEKPIAIRIKYEDKVYEYIMEGFNESSKAWLDRKEKVCCETHHSSYYIFLDNIDSHCYDYMVDDDSYGIWGGSFPLIINNEMKGSITVSGLRPQEDHSVIIDSLKEILEKRG